MMWLFPKKTCAEQDIKASNREFSIDSSYVYNHCSPLRWIISHAARYFYIPLFVVLAALVNNLAYANIQIYIGKGLDLLRKPGWTEGDLYLLVAIIVGSAILQGVTGLSRNFSIEFLAQRLERNTRAELYLVLLGKSQTFHNRHRIGDIMARATNDVRMINGMFSPGLMLISDSALSLGVPLFMISLISYKLLLIPLAFTVALCFTVYQYNKRLKPVSILQREQFGTMNARLAEVINGIEVVKSNVQERYELMKFLQDARLFKDYFVKQGLIQAKYYPLLVFAVAWGLCLFHGLLLWTTGDLSIGQVVSFMGLVSLFRFATFISLFSFNLVQLGMASAARVLALITEETELDQNSEGVSKPIDGKVEFRDVSFSYNGKTVLSHISFTAQAGQTVAIVGQTGSGKTTLTRLINRIFDADEGQVLIDDVDVRDWNLKSLRSQISTIEQEIFLFSRTIRENIAFGKNDASLKAIEQAAQHAQAHQFISRFNQGYDTEVGERGVTLSGGQKQRIAIARAFLTNPKILILDDSTSAVDSKTEELIQRAMKKISEKRTTFIITHRLSQIRWADLILILQKGQMTDIGTHHELIKRSDDYKRIFAFT